MNPHYQQELEDSIDLYIDEEGIDVDPISPITLWYRFEENLRYLHREYVNDAGIRSKFCAECQDDLPCPTVKLLDQYLRET